ncbi:transposase [Paenibacillus filicis]|uniref:Transposase n=1 Tax=Paenibacillus gyeongsangnamensis TaxID=3388067 RepID=A0ABT4Q3T0_9BACL|nr:transposase [Paenibacillus filicis]MCZ8511486.1 transposase [Paenibacillus filicis]
MKPVFVPHSNYQAFVHQQLRTHYGPGIVLINKDWPLAAKLWMTDLSAITTLLHDAYSNRGPLPRDPASLLRSFLIFLMTNPEMGLTEWINEMKRTPIYAILSGFDFDDLPGVGTFYDFFERLWPAVDKHLKPKKQRKRKGKTKKGKKGEIAPTTTPGKVKRLVEWMMRHTDKKNALPADRLFDFFQAQILTVSANLGLLGDVSALSAAGDGTPVVTSAYPRSKPTCDCRARGIADCNHPRLYSQPDCNSGWDSAREKHFNGYHLYMISAADSKHDLPLYPRLQPASGHDAVSLVMSTVEFKQRFTLGTVDKMLLDAAHDAEAIYLLLDHQNIEPFIDLNNRSKKNTATDSDIQISPTGIPICPKGNEMKPNGFDKSQNRRKWRCSPSCGCSDAKYGRTYHTHSSDNLRLYPKTVRGSEKWNLTYKRRTSIERSNKREKIDYKLESGRHRSTMMWYMRIYGIMICQHMDAWYVSQKDEWDKLKSTICPSAA